MTTPLGTTDVSPSGGTMRLAGRIGEGRVPLVTDPMPLSRAIDLVAPLAAPPDPVRLAGPLRAAGQAPFLAAGEPLLWLYGPSADAGLVLDDGPAGLAVWLPSGSARLAAVPADGRAVREVPLGQRFTWSWHMAETTWRGPGVVRWAPTARPWSSWWFFDDGAFCGIYVNLEVPHRRPVGGEARTHSRDLVLDLWIEPSADGRHELWVKDEDEVDAATMAGRYTSEQCEAVVAIGEWAARELFDVGPQLGPWDVFAPTAAQDRPVPLPDTPLVAGLRDLRG